MRLPSKEDRIALPSEGVANRELGILQSGAGSCDVEILPHHDGSVPGAPDRG